MRDDRDETCCLGRCGRQEKGEELWQKIVGEIRENGLDDSDRESRARLGGGRISKEGVDGRFRSPALPANKARALSAFINQDIISFCCMSLM